MNAGHASEDDSSLGVALIGVRDLNQSGMPCAGYSASSFRIAGFGEHEDKSASLGSCAPTCRWIPPVRSPRASRYCENAFIRITAGMSQRVDLLLLPGVSSDPLAYFFVPRFNLARCSPGTASKLLIAVLWSRVQASCSRRSASRRQRNRRNFERRT